MAASGYTPIYLYYSSTTTNTPTAGNLGYGELAINITDGYLFYKDNANAIQKIGYKLVPTTAGGTGLTLFTSGQVFYASSTSAFAQSSNLAFDGTSLSTGGLGVGTTANTSIAKLYLSGTSGTPPLLIATNNGSNATASTLFSATTDNTAYSAKMQVVRGVGSYDLGFALRVVNSGGVELESTRFHSSGGVSIGNTTDPGAANLSVSGATLVGVPTISGFASQASGASSVYATGDYLVRNTASTSGRYFKWGVDSGAHCYIYNDANTGVYLNYGGTSWNANSDERIKDIIEPIANAVEKVATLRAVIGKYKTDEEGVRRSFLIAQDVQAVFPEAVSQLDDEIKTLGLAYSDVIPLLVAAIKEQTETINQLSQRITNLESKNVAN